MTNPEEAKPGPMFDTKLVVVLRYDLANWQRINATMFMVSGIAALDPSVVGEPYEDAAGNQYLPMFRQPGLVFEASAAHLRRAFDRAARRGVQVAVFTDDLFSTGHDDANRAAVRAVKPEDLSLVGIAFRTDRRVADKIIEGLKFHH